MLEALTTRQQVEVFHLLFLRALATGPQKSYLVVKGGANLRFFFGSVRYSEDLDLDISVVARETLRKNVEKVLASPVLRRPLAAHGIEIEGVSAPKQTDTTQRWKVKLETAASSVSLNTKIEFSRRGGSDGARLDAVSTAVAHLYGMTPPLVCHYLVDAAIRQKIAALAGRTEVQARDVFDLALLLAQARGEITVTPETKAVSKKAAARALEVSYDEYVAQVVAYLAPDEGEPYASLEAWQQQRLQVVGALEHLAR